MPTTHDVREWIDQDLVDSNHNKIGKINQVYVDRQTGEPKFVAVKTGLLGSNVSLVPIEESQAGDDHVAVPYSKDQVKDAPDIDADAELSEAEEQRLYEHYGLRYEPYEGPDHGSLTGYDRHATRGRGRATDDAMTRSEEELRVGTTSRESGRARLRKYVVTEQVEKTVPVKREKVRVEREPVTDANVDRALDGPEISEDEHEVVLHAEEPVVETRAVPKERVRMKTDTVTDEETVGGKVRKERIDVDGDADADDRRSQGNDPSGGRTWRSPRTRSSSC
jgi:uncharacterized protein (TIGR02271 family)